MIRLVHGAFAILMSKLKAYPLDCNAQVLLIQVHGLLRGLSLRLQQGAVARAHPMLLRKRLLQRGRVTQRRVQ